MTEPTFANWMKFAIKEIGVREIKGLNHNKRILEYHKATSLKATDDETPWCSAFANWVMAQAGVKGTDSAAARSWLQWGKKIEKPVYGAVVVLSRGKNPWQGHVGFVAEIGLDYIMVLGGNQGDKVSIAKFHTSQVLSYRLPAA